MRAVIYMAVPIVAVIGTIMLVAVAGSTGTDSTLEDLSGLILTISVAVVAFVAYFLPTLVAAQRRARHLGGIIVLNLLLGWTFIGWVGAIVWAVVSPPARWVDPREVSRSGGRLRPQEYVDGSQRFRPRAGEG